MFRRIVMAAPMASVLALCAPAAYQTAEAAAFPQVFGGASSPLLTLVQDRGDVKVLPEGGGGGRGGGSDRGGGPDRGGGGGGGGGMIERGPRGGDGPGGGARRGGGDGDRNVLREERGRGDGDRGDRMRGRDRGDRSAQRDDRRGGDRDFRRGRDRGGRHDGDRIRRHGRHFSWGPGISFYFYDGYYYGDCNWLRRRAIATGSSYWWRRFRQCRAYSW